ncbi:MAG TPA: tetratricopeptide repeat protein [Myxococcota bacterium]|nr:tetratricopeptide repeat protein [Myxococcota bacterium]
MSTRAWLPALLFAAVSAVYLPSIGFGWIYDDVEVVRMQEPARSLADVARIFSEPHGLPLSKLPYYRATTRASLLVQKGWHGDRPGPFHAANALLAGLAALGAFAALRSPRLGLGRAAAAFGAAAFALHPVVSSCVYPVASGRETLLPVTCALFALAAWLRGGVGGRAGGTALLALALLGKEQALVVPALFLAAELFAVTPDPPGRSARAWLARAAPLALVVAGYLALRGRVLPPSDVDVNPLVFIARHLGAAPFGPLQSLGFAVQAWFAPFGRVHYEPSFAAWFDPLRLLLALGLLGAVVALARRAAPPGAVVWWLAFVPIGMGLTLNLFPQEARFAERFVALSSLGFAALLAHALAALEVRHARAAAAAAAIVLLGLAAVSVRRGGDFRDELSFASRWVASDPAQPNARYVLGTVLARQGRMPEALEQLRAAVELAPELAAAHYNLGVLLAEQGRHHEAAEAFREALRHDPDDPAARAALAAVEAAP